MAAALLTGYAWLAVAGGLWAGLGQMSGGGAYDAELHAIFLGFVMSMIFAHAPVIVPSVLGRPLPFRNYLYIPLVLLHVSLILRLAGGDWAGNTDAWQWGGSLNETAILLYIAMAGSLVARSRRTARGTRRAPRQPAAGPPPGDAVSAPEDDAVSAPENLDPPAGDHAEDSPGRQGLRSRGLRRR